MEAMSEEQNNKHSEVDPIEIVLSAFPEAIRKIITDLNQQYNYPIPYLIAGVLYTVSVAVGSTIKLDFPPINGYLFANLFVAIVGERGTNKSAPIATLIKPLEKRDNELIKDYNKQVNSLSNTPSGDKNQIVNVVKKRLLVNDITVEALTDVLYDNPRGVGLEADEFQTWIGGFDRYKKTSGVDESFFLTLFYNRRITFDRKSNSKITHIEHPYLSIIGTIQPSVLQRSITRERIENGFFDRLLIASVDGYPYSQWSNSTFSSNESIELWNSIITGIYEAHSSSTFENIMQFSSAAIDVILSWRNAEEGDNSFNATKEEMALFKKNQVYCLRIAMLLNVLRCACGEINNECKIDETTATYATFIADWFYQNSKDFLQQRSKATLTSNQKDFYDNLPDEFRTAEAVTIGNRFLMKERTVKKFLSDMQGYLFRQMARGHYCKINDTLKE